MIAFKVSPVRRRLNFFLFGGPAAVPFQIPEDPFMLVTARLDRYQSQGRMHL